MKNHLQQYILKRLDAGLPLSRWQQFSLHLLSAWRQLRRRRPSRLGFHARGVLRILWRPVTLVSIQKMPVQLHLSCLLYPTCFLVWLDRDQGLLWNLRDTAVEMAIWCVSLFAHEFAHVATARRFGIPARRIIFIPLGAAAQLDKRMTARQELPVALAGPAASLIVAGCFALVLWFVLPPRFFWELFWVPFLKFGYFFNLFVAGFNLLPCFPMDGGRALRSLLSLALEHMLSRSPKRAYQTATRITVRWVARTMTVAVALTIFRTHDWLDLVIFPLLLLVAEWECELVLEEA